jgi:anti-sigma B factor antagonist
MPSATRSIDGVDVISLSGRLDAAVARAVREEIKVVIEEGSGKLVIDLSDVKFVDSSGLSVLVLALKAAHAKGGRLALLKVNSTVRSLLELTRLHRVFEIFDDEEKACSRLAAAR